MAEQAGSGSNTRRVAVMGLGIMGGAFARHLHRMGYVVTGFDPDPDRRSLAGTEGISVQATPDAALLNAELVLCSLPSAQALADTVDALCRSTGDSPAGNRPLLLELSTLDLESKLSAQRRLLTVGIEMLDCPVSGTGAQADRREIVVYASGPPEACRSARPLLEAISARVVDLGAFGNGTRMKLIANLLVAIHNVAAAEAIAMAERAGMDAAKVCEAITAGGAAGSRVFDLRAPLMSRREYLPATMRLDLWQKDLKLIQEYATGLDATVPLFQATVPLYHTALRQVGGAADTAAVVEVLRAGGGSAVE